MTLRRPTYSEVASTLALTVALTTGGAYAAGKVRTADLAPNAVTSAKIKNGTVAAGDLSPALRSQLASGQPNAPLRKGARLTGNLYDFGTTDAGGDSLLLNVNFPGVSTGSLTDDKVNFAVDAKTATTDDDAACSGTFDAPTAPAGKVCIYLGSGSGLTDLNGQTWGSAVQARRAFYVTAAKTASSGFEFFATWAYTAP